MSKMNSTSNSLNQTQSIIKEVNGKPKRTGTAKKPTN
jgi:hypothetical protein